MAKYFYIRVSSKDQNLARQLEEVKKYDIPKGNVFYDKETGRKFDRREYERMKSLLVKGDEVYFKELDRMGRAKYSIKKELEWFREQGVIARILDIPTTLIDYEGQEWLFDMVNNILIEVYSSVADREWEKTKQRREEGIAAMPVDESGRKISSKTGRGFGRQPKEVDLTLREGETITEACKRLGIDRSTYYRKTREAV
jgi:DNA invertase Pin-like site-specific DNA recombinase